MKMCSDDEQRFKGKSVNSNLINMQNRLGALRGGDVAIEIVEEPHDHTPGTLKDASKDSKKKRIILWTLFSKRRIKSRRI